MRFKHASKVAVASLATSLVLFLTGCTAEQSQQLSRGFLPGTGNATNHTESIIQFWNGSWIVLWGVGIIAWGLMFYAVIVYRRRKGDTSIPRQIRYNNPIETLFTVVPLIMVIGFYAFTAKTMSDIERPVDSDVKIQVIGKQWSWDFNYVSDNAHESGIQATGTTVADEKELPTLWLPVNKSVEISLTSRDVIHSFWVVEFLYKKDMFPMRTNKMYFTPTQVGEYSGKCAELCGEYHSMMLFNVKVVTQAEYDAHIAALKAAGNTGLIDDSFSRNQNLPGDNPEIRG